MRASGRAACWAVVCLLLLPGLALAQQTPTVTVMVAADGETQVVTSSAGTVGELLIDLGITLGDLDRTSPGLTARLEDGAAVRVTRVSCQETVEEVVLEPKTTVLAAPKMLEGESKVVQAGKSGLAKRVVRVWRKDGEVTRREVVREKVLVAPEPVVVLRGTNGLSNRSGMHLPVRMVATGYVPGRCGGSLSGRTATGVKATKGVVAVDPRVISLGSRLYIPEYGFALAADKGSAIKGNRIDLCFDNYREAMRFGRRSIDVYVLR
jgi:3D (Asp-Asp-Asp) domain-containing protein